MFILRITNLVKKKSRPSVLQNSLNAHVVVYPTPSGINFSWSLGALAGLTLLIQIVSGIFLSKYYSPHVDTAFYSVEHIMRDVTYGWCIRYIHSNGASMFFITLYGHMGKNLY